MKQLDDKQIPAFLPTLTKWSRWKDRRKQVEVPLFPGYVFARFDAADRLSVLKCTGVVSIVVDILNRPCDGARVVGA